MEQIEELIRQIEELKKKIWGAGEINIQEIGEFVQSMYPSLLSLLPIIEERMSETEERALFLSGINHVMEGLQYKDKMLLADAFYYEIANTLKLFAENGV